MEVTHFNRQLFIKNSIANSSCYKTDTFAGRFFINILIRDINFDARLQFNFTVEISQQCFVKAAETHSFAFSAFFDNRQVVRTQNHILRRYGNRFTIFRCQNVIDRKHQHSGFSLGFGGHNACLAFKKWEG